MEQYLRSLYYDLDSPVSYTSFTAMWRKIKADKKDKDITKEDLKKWLQEQYVYSLHKPYRMPREYRKTIVPGLCEQWQADLVEMKAFSEFNDGYNYLLCVIDCYSKYAWCEKLKTKTGAETAKAFEKIFHEAGVVPSKMHFDEGKEFYNEKVKSLFKQNDIEYFSTASDKKAAIVERFNRTLKTRMWKYFTAHETRKWIDIIDELVQAYNNTYHTTIKMAPAEAIKPENSALVWLNIYGAYLSAKYDLPKFTAGQTVRISKYKQVFDKGYLPNYTEEFFKIKEVKIGRPIVYILEDMKGEDLTGIFYENELSPYDETEETTFKIEKVLSTKSLKGKTVALVKYKGWPEKFNEWIPVENLVVNK